MFLRIYSLWYNLRELWVQFSLNLHNLVQNMKYDNEDISWGVVIFFPKTTSN